MNFQSLLYILCLFAFATAAQATMGSPRDIDSALTEVRVNYYDNIDIMVRVPQIRDIYKAPELTELECMALNIYFEARGETRLGKELVAQVTMNRKRFAGWDDTVCEVVRQHKQFSWTHDGKIDRPTNLVAYGEAFEIAIDYLIEGAVADYPGAEDLTNFHALSAMPDKWKPYVEYVGKVGNHTFYKPSKLVYDRVTRT